MLTHPTKRSVLLAASVLFIPLGYLAIHSGLAAEMGIDPQWGRNIKVSGPSKVVAATEFGQHIATHYDLTNASDKPITLVGSRTSCTCTMVDELPMVLMPHQTKALPVTLNVPRKSPFGGSIEIYTDDPVEKIVLLTFTGHVARAE